MKTELLIKDHDVLPGAKVVELWYDGKLIGCVYGADGPGVRVVSKHGMLSRLVGPISPPFTTEVRILAEE